jgi:hypothetical protein
MTNYDISLSTGRDDEKGIGTYIGDIILIRSDNQKEIDYTISKILKFLNSN